MTRARAVSVVAVVLALVAGSCDSFYFLRGTLDGDCDPPRTIRSDGGMPDPATLRRSNCQPAGALCCRRSSAAGRTSCQYPEDCYVAPYQGRCATPVDCADSQSCTTGSCQCTLGGPACVNPATQAVTCCSAGQLCMAGVCGGTTDGGT